MWIKIFIILSCYFSTSSFYVEVVKNIVNNILDNYKKKLQHSKNIKTIQN